MSTLGATYKKLAIAGFLAGFLATPVWADDEQASDTQQQVEAPADKTQDSQSASQQEPTYVWKGNHYKGQEATPVSTPASAQAEAVGGTIVVPTTNNLPQADEANGIKFITGGIGEEERNALDAVKSQYSLHITSSNKSGEFDGDTEITVLSKKGDKLLSVTGGPLFYINLPAGAYTLQASSGGRTQKQNISVGGKTTSAYFRW